jgi:hypothetical protein
VSPGTYTYRVKAVNSFGSSAYDGPVTATVNQVKTTTTVVTDGSPSLVGDTVTFTATVTPAAAASAVMKGDVTFTANGGISVIPVVSGVATLTTSDLPAGTFSVTADYSGDAVFLASSASVSQAVDKRASTTTVTSSLNPSIYGDAVTFTMTVAPSPATATGTVQLVVDGVSAGSPVSLVSGSATATLSSLAAGTHTITAVYSGDGTYLGGPSGSLDQVVGKAASTTVVSALPAAPVFGQTVNLTARVTPAQVGVLGGTVQFYVDGVAVGLAQDVKGSGGVATLPWSAWTVGRHAVTASFSGNDNFLASGSAPLSYRIYRAATRTVVTSSGTPARAWSTVRFTATVRVVAPGVGPVSGRVQFQVDGRNFGPIVNVTGGTATLVTAALGAGTHRVRAVYLTSTSFSSSTSTTFRQVMN